MKYIQIIDGPNMNLTGKRQQELYGAMPVTDVVGRIKEMCKGVAEVRYFQNNTEGKLIDRIQESGYDRDCLGIVLNAGGYTHTSVAMADAVAAVPSSVLEVHITNLCKRESFRSKSLLTPVCKGLISGLGLDSYLLAARAVLLDANLISR